MAMRRPRYRSVSRWPRARAWHDAETRRHDADTGPGIERNDEPAVSGMGTRIDNEIATRSGQEGIEAMTQQPARKPSPSPARLRGLRDPKQRVRPVDWTATGARAGASDSATRQRDRAAATDRDGDPVGHGDVAARSNAAATSRSAVVGGAAGRTVRERPRTVELPRRLPAPPEGAVHSLNPDDPRPAPRPLRIREELIRTVGPMDLGTERIVLAFTDPEDAWTADAGASDHFLRGALVIQVRRSDNTVIGAFPAAYALSVRPEEFEPALDIARDAAGPSARGPRGTRHPTTRRELIARMEAAGFVITPGSSHGRVSHPDHPGLFVPLASTPSDRRYTRHAVTQIRRVFGIDLRR